MGKDDCSQESVLGRSIFENILSFKNIQSLILELRISWNCEVITLRFTAIPSELVSAKAWIGKVKGKALDEMDEHDLAFKASILNT